MIITIDGPTASGKSTVARLLAERLGFYYLYSGLLFRGLAYLLMQRGYTLETIAHPSPEDLAYVSDSKHFCYRYDAQSKERIFFQGVDITPHLKSSIIDQAASIVSSNPQVRAIMAHMQRDIAAHNNSVVDGRDSGSVVFAHAAIKFFLTASLKVRAQRWYAQQKPENMSLQQAEKFIASRDDRDAGRKHAPLVVPDNAIIIDTSALSIEQAVAALEGYLAD